MSIHADFMVYDRLGQLALVVEAMNILGTTPEWAAKFRHSLLVDGLYPSAPYFLIALPDTFYLWRDVDNDDSIINPSYVVDAKPVLRRYFEPAGIEVQPASGSTFELIITFWLSDLVREPAEEIDPSQRWLLDSGLHVALYGGKLAQEVAA